MWKKVLSFWARHEFWVALVAVVIGILFPIVIRNEYYITVGTYVLLYAILSLSLNLITGYTGIVVLGQSAFYGVGAYTSAILSLNFGLDFMITLPCALLLSFLAGTVIGVPTLRLSGRYLSIVTLGFGEIMRIIEQNWQSLTGGVFGLKGISAPVVFGFKLSSRLQKYYLVFVMLVLCALVVKNLMNSRTGLALSAIKGDEIAAESMGVSLFKNKVLVFATSATIAGAAGAFYSHFVGYIDSTSFNYDQSTQILGMTIMGGLGSIAGSILGSLIYNIIPELLRFMIEYRLIIYGAILVIMIIFRPNGILGGFSLKQIRQYEISEKELEAQGIALEGGDE